MLAWYVLLGAVSPSDVDAADPEVSPDTSMHWRLTNSAGGSHCGSISGNISEHQHYWAILSKMCCSYHIRHWWLCQRWFFPSLQFLWTGPWCLSSSTSCSRCRRCKTCVNWKFKKSLNQMCAKNATQRKWWSTERIRTLPTVVEICDDKRHLFTPHLAPFTRLISRRSKALHLTLWLFCIPFCSTLTHFYIHSHRSHRRCKIWFTLFLWPIMVTIFYYCHILGQF